MRRREKQMASRSEIDEVIHSSAICRLAFARNDEPYLVPLSFGYNGDCLFFHTALEGRKIDFLRANPRVCFELEHRTQLIAAAAAPCNWGFGYQSIIGWGRMEELVDTEEKRRGLICIVDHYRAASGASAPDPTEIPFTSQALAKVRVWRLDIESITGKKSPAP